MHLPQIKFVVAGAELSKIFGVMERAKNEIGLEDYSVTQPTLQQVFLDLTKDQVVEVV